MKEVLNVPFPAGAVRLMRNPPLASYCLECGFGRVRNGSLLGTL